MAESKDKEPALIVSPTVVKKLADIGRVKFTIDIEDVDGTAFSFVLKVPSARRWSEISRSVTFPKPPFDGFDAQKRPIPDFNDQTFLNAQAEANATVNFRLLAEALIDGGMDIPGDTLEERADAVRDTLSTQMAVALIDKLQGRGKSPEVSASERAVTFQR